MEQKNKFDATPNISDLLEAYIENAKDIEGVVVGLAKSVDAISKKVDAKQFKKSSQQVKELLVGINDYMGLLGDVIQELSSPKNGIKFDDDFAKAMLGIDKKLQEDAAKATNDKQKDTLEEMMRITKSSSIPQQILAFSSVIGELFKSFDKIGSFVANPKSLVLFEMNMKLMRKNLIKVINVISDTLKNLDSSQIKDALSYLVAEPDSIKTTITNLENEQSKEKLTENITESTKGRQGLMDVILGIMNVFQLMNSLQFPSILKFKIRLGRNMRQLSMLWDSMSDFISGNEFDSKKMTEINKVFETLPELYITIQSITEKINEIGTPKNKRRANRAKTVIDLIFGVNTKGGSILVTIGEAVSTKEFNAFTSDDVLEKLKNFQANIKKIKDIAISISIIGLLAAPMLLGIVGLAVLQGALKVLFWMFNKETLEKVSESEQAITKIALIAVLLSTSVMILALTGQLVSESIDDFAMVVLYLITVTIMFSIIGLIVNLMDEINVTQSVLWIAGTLGLLSLTVIILVLSGKLIEEEWDSIWKVLAFLGALTVAFVILAVVSKFIQEGSKSMIMIAASVAILSAVVYILIGASYLVQEQWTPILQVLALMGILVAAVIGVAYAGTLVTAGAAVLMALGASMTILVVSLIILVNAVEKVQKLGIKDTEEAKEIMKIPIAIIWGAVEYASHLKTELIIKGTAKIMALGAVSFAISNMADTIQKFAELRIPIKFDKFGRPVAFKPMTKDEFNAATENIKTILTTIISTIGSDELKDNLNNLNKKAAKNIGLIMDNTAGVVNLIDAIEKAVKFDDETIEKGVGNLQELISAYLTTLQRLFVGDGELVEKSWFGKRSFKLEITKPPMIDASKLKTSIKTLKDLQKTLDPVNALMSSIDQMSKPTEDTASNIGKIVQAYAIGILGDGTNKNKGLQIDAKSYEKVNVLRKLVTEQERIANIKPDNFQKNTENFVKFVDKANSIDTNKIRSIRDMFEQMAHFSESVAGDFDKLADVLSEKLVDILEKLHGTLKSISESEPANSFTSTTETTNKTTVETKQEQSDANKQEQERIKTLENQKAQDIRDINNAITEITELLKQVKNNTEKRKGFEF
jgi:hypothetical protein